MLLLRQFRLNAFEQQATDAVQRPTYIRLESLQSTSNINGAKAFGVTQLKQFLICGIELFPTTPQGSQADFHSAAFGNESGFSKSIQQFLTNVIWHLLLRQELAHLELCCLTCPREEATALPKGRKLTPKNQANRLE